MEHSASAAAKLQGWLTQIGVGGSSSQLEDLVAYTQAILGENQRINVTAIRELDDALRLHVVDSALGLRAIANAPEGAVLDLGTGGGFPGVVIGILSAREVLLLDSVRKKTEAIHRALGVLEPERRLSVRWARSEALAMEAPASFSVVTARAVAELPVLVELAAPLLTNRGRLVAFKGVPGTEELERADRVAKVVGLRRLETTEFELPEGGERRTILVFGRIGASSIGLPRNPGLAAKSPLA